MSACANRSSVTLYADQDHEKYVCIAAIDPAWAEHVHKLLDNSDIPNLVEGSIAYGVSVPPPKKDEALRILKEDVEKQGYWARL